MILKSNFWSIFSRHVFPMRYNAKSLEINVVISGKVLLFKDIKISLGLLITAREMHALFRENHFLEVSTTTAFTFMMLSLLGTSFLCLAIVR